MKPGLEDVVVAETVLSHADPARGMLWVRRRTVAELVARHGYEGTVALLWDGFGAPGLHAMASKKPWARSGSAPSHGSKEGSRSLPAVRSMKQFASALRFCPTTAGRPRFRLR